MTGDLILVEVLQVFSNDRDFDAAKRRLTVIDLAGADIAVQAAQPKTTRALQGARFSDVRS